MSRAWKSIDQISLTTIRHLRADDVCIYAKDYISGAGFQGGVVNSDILNFKKTKDVSGQHYRTQAIHKFALEASELFDCDKGKKYTVTAIPSSKAKTDPLYDDRFEDFFSQLKNFCPCIDIVWPVSLRETIKSAHHGGTREPNEIRKNYVYEGFLEEAPEFIIVFDDVLTSGAHFRACKDFLLASGYTGKIYGVFWAKAHVGGPNAD